MLSRICTSAEFEFTSTFCASQPSFNFPAMAVRNSASISTLRAPWRIKSRKLNSVVANSEASINEVVAVIELDEGIRYVGNVVDIEPEEVEVGMRVIASIELVDDEMKLPVFRRA